MDKTLKNLVRKLYAIDLAKYDTEKVISMTEEDFDKEIDALYVEDIIEVVEESREGSIVEEEFNEGGRWTNYKKTTYRFSMSGEGVYYRVIKEIPATEMQEGSEGDPGIERVYPHKIETVVYKLYPQEEGNE